MALSVRMLENAFSSAGTLLVAGTQYSLADDLAQQLVGQRRARPVGNGWSEPATALRAAQVAAFSLSRLRSVLTRSVVGRFAVEAHSTTDRTTNIQMILAAPFRAVRIGIINASTTNTVAGVKCCVAATANVGAVGSDDIYLPSGGVSAFVQATFAGVATATLPAAAAFTSPAATSSTNYTVTWTDWVDVQSLPRADGGSGFALIARVLVPGTTNQAGNLNRTVSQSTGLDNWADASIVGWRTYRAARRDADAVTDPSLFFTSGTGTWTDSHQVIVVQYASERPGYQLNNFGDSIGAGEASGSAPPMMGPGFHAAVALHTDDVPCEYANFAVGSSNTANAIVLAEKWMPLSRPSHAIWSLFTPNLSMTAANIAIMHGKTGRFLDQCNQYGATPVLWTGLPSTPIGTEGSTQGKTWTLAEDALRLALNAQYVAGSLPCVDLGTFADGGAMGSGQRKLAQAYSEDGLHPNAAFNAAAGALLAAAVA